jgi:hypothetical protein
MYYFYPFRDAVIECASKYGKSDNNAAAAATDLLQLTAVSTAYVYYGANDPEADLKLPLSRAWEDIQVAFSGFGNSHMTGVIVNWWESIDNRYYSECRNTLNAASMEAERKTPKETKRRYFQDYRSVSVRTPNQGFDMPQAMPCWGPGLTQWHADAYEVDLDTLKVFLAHIEESERMGLTPINVTRASYVTEDGKEVSSSGVIERNPFWKDQQGKPMLKLVD